MEYKKLSLMIIFLIFLTGCSTQDYLVCKNNLSETQKDLNTCKENLENSKTINTQLTSNETYIVENINFETVKNVYLNKNIFLFITYELVLEIVFTFNLILSGTIIFRSGGNKIIIGITLTSSILISLLLSGLF